MVLITIENFDTTFVTPLYNVTGIKLVSARIPGAPPYVTLKMSIGDDVISQRVITKGTDCHYFGKLLLRGDLWDNSTDEVSSNDYFPSIDVLHVSFENPDGTPFVPSDWILKFSICGTTDKMCTTRIEEKKENSIETIVSRVSSDPIILISIGFLVIGLLVLVFMKR